MIKRKEVILFYADSIFPIFQVVQYVRSCSFNLNMGFSTIAKTRINP